MKSCPNTNTKEWKDNVSALEKLGLTNAEATTEAYRDYFKYEDIRNKDAVVAEYQTRKEQNEIVDENMAIIDNINLEIANNTYEIFESPNKATRRSNDEKAFLKYAPLPSYVTRVTDNKTKGGYGTNIDDYTRNPIRFIYYKNDVSKWTGRELYTSEIFALTNTNGRNYNGKFTYSQRMGIIDKLAWIEKYYGIKFNYDYSEYVETYKPVVYCEDIYFLDYLHQNINKEGLFVGSPETYKMYLISKGIDPNTYKSGTAYMEIDPLTNKVKRKGEKQNEISKYTRKNKKAKFFIDNERIETCVEFLTGKPVNWKNCYDSPSSNVYDSMTEEEISAMALLNESSNMRRFKDASEYFERRAYNYTDMLSENAIANLFNIRMTDEDTAEAEEFIRQISNNLNIDYEIISIEEAKTLLENTKIPFNEQTDACFFFQGKVYFIKNRIDKHLAVHEFSHPFISAIKMSNPDLFADLYDRLSRTESGRGIIKMVMELYPEYAENSDDFKEECIVMSMEYTSRGTHEDKPFKNYLQYLLYQLRQFIRRTFQTKKSLNLSNLDFKTSLSDLLEILKDSDKIDVTKRDITKDDIARFSHGYNELIDDIENTYNNSQLSVAIDKTFDVYNDYAKQLSYNKDFATLKKLYINTHGQETEFQKSFKSAKNLHDTKNINLLSSTISQNELLRMRAHTLGKTIVTMTKMAKDMHGVLIDISNKPLDKESVQQIYSYNKLLDFWMKSLDELKTIFNDKKSLNNPKILNNFIDDSLNDIKSSKELINDMFLDIATDVVYEELQSKYDLMEDIFNERKDELQTAPQLLQDKLYKEYTGMTKQEYEKFESLYAKGVDNMTIDEQKEFAILQQKSYFGLIKTKDQIRDCIKGELGDVDYLNSKFEGYLYSTDPVVGSFASFLRDQITKAELKSQKEFNEFFSKIAPDLEKMNMNKMKVGEFGKRFLFKDTVLTKDNDGNYVRKQVWTFKNPFKDYRADYMELEKNADDAYKAWEANQNDANYKAYLDEKIKFDTFKIKFMNQDYVPEYYEPFLELISSPAGQAALLEKEKISLRLKMLRMFKDDPLMNYSDNIDSDIEELEFQLRRLSSLYNLDGTLKSKTSFNGEPSDYDKALALRDYNKKSMQFVDYDIDYESFDKDFIAFYKSLIDAGYTDGSDMFNSKIKEWTSKNMKAQLTDHTQASVDALLAEMDNVRKRLSPDAAKVMDEIRTLINGTKDGFGEIMEELFKEEWIPKIKEAQEFANSLSVKDAYMKKLAAALNKLVSSVPTQHYLDQLRYQLTFFTKEELEELGFVGDEFSIAMQFTNTFAEGDNSPLDLFVDHPEFEKWFNENHIRRNWSTSEGEYFTYNRLLCHNKMVGAKPEYNMSYTVIDKNTNAVIMTLPGLPGSRYRKSFVRDEYKTEKTVGKTVDNKDNWLPRIINGSPYVNEEYINMDKTSPEYRVLEQMKELHLRMQENSPYSSRLYLDAPRFRSEMKEIVYTGVRETLNMFLHRMKMFFTGGADDFEFGTSSKQKNMLMEVSSVDSMSDNFSHIPVSGRYDLDIDDVSTNIFRSMFRYYKSLDRENSLRDVAPVASALQTSVKENKIRINQFKKGTSAIKFLTKDENLRSQAIDNLIEREYEGITLKGPLAESVAAQNIINFLFGRASFSFFAMNVPSALKNSFGIKFQALLESSTGKYLTPQALAFGNIWSYEAMGEMTFGGFYDSRNTKSMKRMIVEAFDLQGQDIAGDTFMDPLWRSFGNDILDLKFLYFPRKWVEQQATCQVGSAILYKHKVNRYDSEGNKTSINYIDAFEVVDGVLKIKDGVNVRYGLESVDYIISQDDTMSSIIKKFNLDESDRKYIDNIFKGRSLEEIKQEMKNVEDKRTYQESILSTSNLSDEKFNERMEEIKAEYERDMNNLRITFKNDKFLDIHKEIQQVNNDLGGAYSKFDQPDMYRNIIYRFCAYMRRYFTTMFMNRFRWNSRYNPGLGNQQRGYYIQTADFLINIFRTAGKNIMFASNEEKRALIKFGTELVMLSIIPLLCSCLFGYDPDDEDRYKKLKSKSGSLSAPFVVDDEKRRFNLLGFTELHALHLLMQIRQENEQFNPFCGGVKQINSMLDLKSVVWGPTTDSFTQILDDLKKSAQNDPRAYYTRDVGPYEWQQKGSNKTANHLAKMFGFTGTSLDPALAIQNLQANISKIHR